MDMSHSKSFILSQDLSEVMASMTNVCVNPLDFALASLVQLLFVRSAALLISVSHSSNFVEPFSLKTAISCSNELVRFIGFLCSTQGVHVLMYYFSEGFS